MYWHIDTDIVALIVTCALCVYTMKNRPLGASTAQDRSFLRCLFTGVVLTIVDIASSLAMDTADSFFMYHLLMTIYLAAQDIAIVAWFLYCLTILYHDEEEKIKRGALIVAAPYAFYVLLAVSNPWTGVFYTLSKDMVYARSPLFLPLLLGVFALYVVGLFLLIVLRRKHMPAGYPWIVLVMQPIILALATVVQLSNPGWLMIMPGYTICLVLAFLFFQNARLRNDETQLTQLMELVENFACGVAIGNITPTGECKMYYVSQELCDIFEEDSAHLIAHYNEDIVAHILPADRDTVRDVLDRQTLTGEGSETNFRIKTDTGRIKWLNVKMRPVRQKDGTLRVYTTYNDISAQASLQQRLSDFIQNVPAGICVYQWDGDDLHPITVNARYSEMLGEDAMQYLDSVDHFSYEHVHPDDLERLKQDIIKALTETHWMDTSYRSLNYKTGEYLWIHLRGKVLPQEDGTQLVLVSYNDVTQEHAAEQELWAKYELERKRVAVGEENMIAHAVFNLMTDEVLEYTDRNGNDVPIEERTAFTFGFQNAHLLIDHAERVEFLTLNDKETLLECFAKGETEFKLEYRKLRPSGNVTWVRSIMHLVRDPRGSDVLLFEYWYDIDEPKMRELMYRSIASDNYDFIARVDGRTKRFITFPQAGRSGHMPPLSGEDADEVTRSLYDESVLAEDREMAIWNSLIETVKINLHKKGRFQFTYRELEEDGSLHYKKMTQYYLDAQRESIIMLREDVTEIIKEEAEKNALLSAALSAANQASEAKSQFLSRVSHELRTPLNAIIGFLDLAKRANAAEMENYLAHSDVAAKQLLSIINDVLDVSSIEAGKMRLMHAPFDMRRMISTIGDVCKSQCDAKGLTFETHFETDVDEWLTGDQHRVEQVLMNLLGNAVKFTEKGFVRLSLSQREAGSDKVFLRFEVSDSGCGMSKQMQQRLFKPFEQENVASAQKYGGNGLGLSIVSSLVNMMGGSVRVESVQGTGSIFTVNLPFNRSGAQIDLPDLQNVGPLHALIVDNDATEREYLSTVLDHIGVRNEQTANGADALLTLARAKQGNDAYNICFIDWRMPGMDGIETTRRIRELYGEHMIVIIISAYDHYQANESARAAGANLYITKPVIQSSLYDLFAAMVGERFEEKAEAQPSFDFSGKRALIAEDNAMNRMVMQSIVESLGLTCEMAEDGQIALERFTASKPGDYDIVLMDIQMPNMDGLEATRRIRASAHPNARSIPVIAVTANAFNEDIAKSLSAGMNAHVSKPIDKKILAAAMEKAFKEMQT